MIFCNVLHPLFETRSIIFLSPLLNDAACTKTELFRYQPARFLPPNVRNIKKKKKKKQILKKLRATKLYGNSCKVHSTDLRVITFQR